MTTTLPSAGRPGLAAGHRSEALDSHTGSDGSGRAHKRWFAGHPAWPISSLLVLWPLWWILGVGNYLPILLAIPMLRRMYRWRLTGDRRILAPPGWGLWLMFLLVSVAGIATINLTAPGTEASPVSSRVISWALRLLSYTAAGIYLLYAGNLTEREYPRRRLAFHMGLLGIYTVAGGLAGVAVPNVTFTSPLAYLIPKSLQQNNGQIQMLLHPATSQVQSILGYAHGRPDAPFSYTNMWGNSLAILLPWLLVAWWSYGNRRQRSWVVGVFLLAFVPVVYSLDRGLWVGLGFAVLYTAVRHALQGKLLMLGLIGGALVLVTVVIIATPLGSLINQRLHHGASNTGRTADTILALKDAVSSPVVGYGDTRHTVGSSASITVGKTASCHSCGQSYVGGDGQLQLLWICSGLVGSVLYIGFFGYGAWRYRRDRSPYGMVAMMVILVGFVYMFVYEAVGPPLIFTMLAYSLLWRGATQDQDTESEYAESTPPFIATVRQRAVTGRVAGRTGREVSSSWPG